MNYAEEVAIADNSTALLDRLDLLLTAQQLTQGILDNIKAAIDDVAINSASANEDRLRRVHIAVLLILASTDYLIQK